MRITSLNEINEKVSKQSQIIQLINDLVESMPNYSSERKRPRDKVEYKLLKKIRDE